MASEAIDILRKLSEVRATIRLRLGLHGACAVLTGGCLSLMTVIGVDWLLELPPLLRVFGAAMFILGFGWAFLHWLVRPLQAPLTLAQVAGQLERHFGDLDDRLTSAVSFLTTPSDASPDLMRQVIANTNQVVAELPLERVLTRRPLWRQAGLLAAAASALLALALTAGDWLSIGVRRYGAPFAELQWPRDVSIEPLSGDLKVPIGESATVRMRVRRGQSPNLRGVVHLVDSEGERRVLAMHRDPADEYRCTVDGVSSDLIYWFEAGDDDTHRTPSRMTVVRRPGLVDVYARIRPPPYAVQTARSEYDLRAGAATAVPGSVAEIVVRTTHAVGRSDAGTPTAWLVPQGVSDVERRIGLSFFEGDAQFLLCSVPVQEDLRFRVEVVDRDGFGNRDDRAYAIRTVPDHPPRIFITEPSPVVETTPRGAVQLRLRTEDDFGLTDLRIVGESPNEASAPRDGRFAVDLLQSSDLTVAPGGVTASTDFLWQMQTLLPEAPTTSHPSFSGDPSGSTPPRVAVNLQTPTTLLYHIEATDNRSFEGVTGQVTKSPPMRVKVISEAEFQAGVRDEIVRLERRLRATLQTQQSILDETRDIHQNGERTDALSAGEVDRLLRLANQQHRAARDARELSQRFARIARRLTLNALEDEAPRSLATLLESTLEDVADAAMTEAAAALHQAADRGARLEADSELQAATDLEGEATRVLRELLDRMDQWGDFQAKLTKTRELLDRQERLRRETGSLRRETLGKRREELRRSRQLALRQLQRKQNGLTDELEGLLQRLRQDAASPDDAGSAAAMRSALRAASGAEVREHMAGAARAIDENRLTAASAHQQRAAHGLRRMLAGLEEKEMRRLADLAKRLERIEEVVAELLMQQEGLLAETREAVTVGAATDVFTDFARPQAQLRRNARGIARDLTGAMETAAAGDLLNQAAQSMRSAVTELAAGRGDGAPDPQTVAVDRIRAAADLLLEQARRANHDAAQKLMAAMSAELEDIRASQQTVNDETRRLRERAAARGRLDRKGARQSAGLAVGQDKLVEATATVRDKLKRSVVYYRVLDGVLRGMRVSQDALSRRRIDEDLLTTQSSVLRRLEQLVRALHEAAALPPSDEFAEGGGRGRGHAAGRQIGIPTPAELLMLKTMQSELLADTIQLGATRAADREPTESDLESAELLGARQREVRELTAALAENTAGGQQP